MPGVKVCLLILSTLIIYHSVIRELGFAWLNNPYYNHGFAFPLISLFLIWLDRNKIRRIEVKPSFYGFLLSWVGVFIFILDHYFVHELFPAAFSMLIFLGGMILLFFGKGYFKATLFPVFLLSFMIPVPDFILNLLIVRLQLLAAVIGATILRILGVPVLRDGVYLQLAPFLIKVDASCSSIHSLIALSTSSFVIAYMMADSMSKRIIIVASSIPVAMLANGLRIVLIVMLGLWMGAEVLHSPFHSFSGKLFFACATFVLILEAIILKGRHRSLKKILFSFRRSPSERASFRQKFNQFKASWTKERAE